MKIRRGISPILGLMVLIVMGSIIASLLYFSEKGGSSFEMEASKLRLINIYQAELVSVDNAGWQLALLVLNQGNGDGVLNRVYLNGDLVGELGYNHGDTLPNKTSIASSVPSDGLSIPANSHVTVYIWIGEDLYSRGTQITINLQKPNQLILQKTITLN
mgnify:CR=1 FL=1